MGKGNKTSTTTQQQQQSSTAIDPIVQGQVYKDINDANTTAANWQPAPIQGPAGLTPDQQAGFDATRAAGTAGVGATQQGMDAASKAAGYAPQQISGSTYDPTQFTAQNYTGPTGYGASGYTAVGADSQGYDAALASGAQGYQAQQAQAAQLNRGNIRDISGGNTLDQLPSYLQNFDKSYQTNVIDSALNDLNRARVMSTQNNDAAAARAGAWGSRRDLLDAETNRGFADAAARTSADLRNQGFTQALGSLTGDQQRNMAAQAANQGADVSAYGANANLQQSANLANADASNQAAAFGANANNAFTQGNQAAQNQARAFQAQAANQASLSKAAAINEAGQFGANAQNQAGQFNAGLGAQIGFNNQNAQNAASQFNANSANQAGQFNAGQQQNAAQANQQAGLAGNAQTLAAGQTLAGIGGQQQNMAYNNAAGLNQIGTQQQALNQAGIDVANANAQNQANAPLTQLQIQQSGMNGAVYGTTSNGTSNGTQTTVMQPSLGSSIGSMIGTGLQIGGMMASGGLGAGAKSIMSDKRLKKNIMSIGNPMGKVRKMTGVDYEWKDGGADSGLLAQDVAKASPRAVKNMGSGILGYNPAPVLGLLVEAVKHLDKRVGKGGK